MELNEENIALFDRFLRNEMQADERDRFQKKLETDAKFNAEFKDFKAMEQALEDAEISIFKDKLNDWDKVDQTVTKRKTGRIINLKVLAVAASAIVIGTFVFMYLNNGPVNNQAIASAYFVPYDNVLTTRGQEGDIDQGLAAYEQENYQEAIEIFEAYPENDVACFYLGEALLAKEDYDAAIVAFNSVLNTSSIFDEIAVFHLALAELGNENRDEAINILKSIPKESDYFLEANRLLEELE